MNLLTRALINLVRPIPIRGKFRVLSTLLPRAGKVAANVNGIRMDLELGDVIQRTIYLGSFELPETGWVRQILRKGDVAVDVGANVGYYTALFSSIVGRRGRVLAVEANPRLCDQLAAIICDSSIQNVDLIAAGASDSVGRTSLFIPRGAQRDYNATMARNDEWEELTVPLVRLGDEVEGRGLRRIRLMKVDVEGHETQVLRGMEAQLMDGHVEHLLIELNDYALNRQGTSAKELADFCRTVGFEELVFGRIPKKGESEDVVYRHQSVSM